MRFKLTLEYAGTRYSGWQIQKNAKTVQGEIERAIIAATGEREFELYGSGRTDAGVHALAQVAHLDIHTTMPPETLRRESTTNCPRTSTSCSPRRSATSFTRATTPSAHLHLPGLATTDRVCQAVCVVGERGSRSRRACRRLRRASSASTTSSRSPTRPARGLDRGDARALDIREDGDLIVFRVDGSHFIWKLVRRLVGVIVEVGRGGLTPTSRRSAVVRFRSAGAVDRAGVWTLSRVGSLQRRPPDQGRLLSAASHPSAADRRRADHRYPGRG
jgi:tRNA pseudouridine38-40 synthase